MPVFRQNHKAVPLLIYFFPSDTIGLKELKPVEITYLEHCGFFIELEQFCLLFDYWQGALPAPIEGKALLTFSSHAHHDHFTREIFSYGQGWAQAFHILGNDIRLSAKRKAQWQIRPETLHRMGPDMTLSLQGVTIRTLRSTDAGVAFLVEAEGRTIYHAGDLNWWVWEGEPDADNEAMTRAFLNEMEKLRSTPIDLAFLTLDGRQQNDMFRGFDYCMRHLRIRQDVPMHSFGDYGPHYAILEDPTSLPYREKILLMTRPGMKRVV